MTQSNLNVLTDRGSRSSKGDGEANTAEAGRRSIGDSVFNLNIGDDPESPPGRGSRRSSRLSGVQKEKLAHKLHDKLKAKPTEELDVGNHNSHADTNMSILTAFISGIINYLLMFGLCAAYGLIMFADDHNGRHIPLGVKMNLGSAMISGLLVSCFSKIRVAIGGPDLNPVVLLGSFVDSMQVSIADQLGLQLPTGGRRLASSGGGGQTFCYGAHLASYPTECETFHAQLRATTIFATAVSSLVFVILFLMFGRFRLTRYVTYIPTSILEAFLSCVGYKVFLYALKFCKYDPFQFVPAACIGVPLYFMKAYHVGHPGIVMPLGFLLPLGAFYVVVYGIMGSDVDTARKDKLMFPLMDNVDFWSVWTDSVGKAEYINFKAWLTTLPDLAIMMILVLLDCMLKIIGTESKLHMKVDKDYEVTLHGLSNILTTLTGSSVGYMQLKFNVINAGVMRNVQDRRGAMFYAIFCGACYFGTIAPINYMPRFFVGSLLFFAGSGFVCENLWGSRRYLHTIEWVEVVLILAVFIITGQLLVAVITGVCICGISFIVKYAKVPTIEGKPMRGADLKIVERRGPLILRNIRHVTESWLLVVRLKGFVFFASAQSLTAHVLGIIESEAKQKVPRYRRLRFVVFDCKGLDGVDASASKALASFVRDAREHKVRVIWSGLSKHFKEQFSRGGILGHAKDVLGDLDEAVMSVEDMALRYLQNIESRWIALHQSFADNHRLTKEHYHFEPFVQIFMSTTGRIGCPWQYCSKMRMEGHDTVLWSPGEQTGMLYLVHSGAVGLFKTLPKDDEHWGSPVAVYRHGGDPLGRGPPPLGAPGVAHAALRVPHGVRRLALAKLVPLHAARLGREGGCRGDAEVARADGDHHGQVTHGEVVVNHCSGLSACKAWALHPSSEHFTVESGSGAERFGEVKHRGGFSLDDFASMLCRCVIAWCLHRTLFLLAGDPTKALESPAEEEEGKPLEVSAAAWGEGSSLAMRWTQLQRKIAVSFLINGELWGRESRAVMGSMKPSEAVCVGEDLSPEQWNLLFQRARAQGLASTLPSNDEVARANHKSAKKKAGHHGHHRAKT